MTKIKRVIAYVERQCNKAYHPTKRMLDMANVGYWDARADILDEVLARLRRIERCKR
jgi:hypothetical protein